jgi:hypothetical protein
MERRDGDSFVSYMKHANSAFALLQGDEKEMDDHDDYSTDSDSTDGEPASLSFMEDPATVSALTKRTHRRTVDRIYPLYQTHPHLPQNNGVTLLSFLFDGSAYWNENNANSIIAIPEEESQPDAAVVKPAYMMVEV